MAAPINQEELTKLKSFIEFVSANPAILNLPQLGFFKKLIEQFGGKVPEGTFQMPAGAKCPFGGDVKCEDKSTTFAADEADEEVPEMEAESEESEVELDTEANNTTVLEANILYLDEKPPKIFKAKKLKAIKKSSKKIAIKMETKQNPTSAPKKRPTKIQQDYIIKKEFCVYDEDEEKMENNDPNDPLYTAKMEVKCELDDENQNDSVKYDCEEEEQDDYDNDLDFNYEQESKFNNIGEDFEYEDDEDEPLIMLSRRKGRPPKKIHKLEEGKIKAPRNVVCREICRQSCTEKFTEEERINICNYYWNLNKEKRSEFIRKHIRARRLTRMKRINAKRSRGNNCYYYLKPYKIGSEDSTPEKSSDLIRVCRKFFEATLCTTNHFIKKANDGSVLEIEKDLLLLSQMKLAKEKSKEPKQILDPATGNLITLDSKTAKTKEPKTQNTSQGERKEKKKRIRRKPGDPLPEHFPKPIHCALRCIYKCHTKFTEDERKQICDIFWSMDYKRRKDFILANIELKDIETQTTPDFRKSNRPPRTFQTRFFLPYGGMRGEKLRVCKDFYAKTLCINRYFIDNAIQFADKTTGYYTGTDRRGAHLAHNKISVERKQAVLDHIESYPFWIPNKKTKTKYLHHSLTIKKMHEAYKEKCLTEKIDYVSIQYYSKAFHDHFHLLFLSYPHHKKGWGLQKANPNVSHYTGVEPGGCWIDSKGNKLDIRLINPAESLNTYQRNLSADSPYNASMVPNPFASESSSAAAQRLLNVVNPASFLPTANQPQSADLNSAIYRSLPQDSINMLRML